MPSKKLTKKSSKPKSIVALEQTERGDIFYNPGFVESTMKMADIFFDAKCFSKSIQNKEQAFIILMAGRELGLSPIDSMNGLGMVNGKVIDWGEVMVSMITREGFRTDFEKLEKGPSGAEGIRVKIWDDKESYFYDVYKDDKMIVGKQGMAIAPLNKMFYHGVRQIIKFKLSHIKRLHKVTQLYSPEEAEAFEVPKSPITNVDHTPKEAPKQTNAQEFASIID